MTENCNQLHSVGRRRLVKFDVGERTHSWISKVREETSLLNGGILLY